MSPHGLVLLFGIGTKASPSIMGFEDEVERSFGRPYRQIDGRSKRLCELTSSREGHHSTARWSSSFLLSDLVLRGFQLPPWLVPESSGTRCRQPKCGA
jgi:hypothetical protein